MMMESSLEKISMVDNSAKSTIIHEYEDKIRLLEDSLRE